jgi:predicted nucleic acid-binding protein
MKTVGAYQAEHLRIAKEANVSLATTDEALIRAAGTEGITIFQP